MAGQAMGCWGKWEPSIPGFSLSSNSYLSLGSPAVPVAAPAPCGAVFPAQLLCKAGGCAASFPACKAREQLQEQQRSVRGSWLVAGSMAPAASVPGVLLLRGSPSPSRESRQKQEKPIVPLCV